jgi:hypothetical protein
MGHDLSGMVDFEPRNAGPGRRGAAGRERTLTKSLITVENPAHNDRANQCPNYAEPAVRVAVSQAEQRAKCSRE